MSTITHRHMQLSRAPHPLAIAACVLGLVACGVEATPPLDQVEFVFWETQSWETGGGTTRLTIWADGKSEMRVYPGPAHLFPGSRLQARPGWQESTAPSGITFVNTSPMTPTEARQRFAAAVQAGISLLETEKPEYVDGGGVLLGARVGGELHQATIPTFNEHLRQQTRFDAVAV